MTLLIIIISLAIHVFLAVFFSSHASAKGYDFAPYFWLCLLLGVIGWCVVAVLPDLELTKELDRLWQLIESQEKEDEDIPDNPNGDSWICKKCKTENKMNFMQCKKCGTYKGQ